MLCYHKLSAYNKCYNSSKDTFIIGYGGPNVFSPVFSNSMCQCHSLSRQDVDELRFTT